MHFRFIQKSKNSIYTKSIKYYLIGCVSNYNFSIVREIIKIQSAILKKNVILRKVKSQDA